jgi:hypothetical protein
VETSSFEISYLYLPNLLAASRRGGWADGVLLTTKWSLGSRSEQVATAFTLDTRGSFKPKANPLTLSCELCSRL